MKPFRWTRFVLGCRGQSRMPAWWRWLPARLLQWAAQQRRAAGWYDRRTLALYRSIWIRQRSGQALLRYTLFRRDLGRSLPRRFIATLTQRLAHLNTGQRRMALDLLAEAGDRSCEDQASDPVMSELQVSVRAMQAQWRADFAHWLRQRQSRGICVVGNGGCLIGCGLGGEIDQHAVVVRFNQFMGGASSPNDIGGRVDVWVSAPGFSGPVPPEVGWLVVSGPEMAFRLQDWRRFEAAWRKGARILTIPLQPWADLVGALQAPPSAIYPIIMPMPVSRPGAVTIGRQSACCCAPGNSRD